MAEINLADAVRRHQNAIESIHWYSCKLTIGGDPCADCPDSVRYWRHNDRFRIVVNRNAGQDISHTSGDRNRVTHFWTNKSRNRGTLISGGGILYPDKVFADINEDAYYHSMFVFWSPISQFSTLPQVVDHFRNALDVSLVQEPSGPLLRIKAIYDRGRDQFDVIFLDPSANYLIRRLEGYGTGGKLSSVRTVNRFVTVKPGITVPAEVEYKWFGPKGDMSRPKAHCVTQLAELRINEPFDVSVFKVPFARGTTIVDTMRNNVAYEVDENGRQIGPDIVTQPAPIAGVNIPPQALAEPEPFRWWLWAGLALSLILIGFGLKLRKRA